MPANLLVRILAALALTVLSSLAAAAQSFTPVARVNDEVVTAWELQQRQRMLAVLNAPPEAQAEALQMLINERIQLQAAASVGAGASEAEVAAGIDEFASRGNLSGEEFLTLIGNAGIDAETVRDFVRAGVAWRNAVIARFDPETRIRPDEVRREREVVRAETGPRVLLAEIELPARNEVERVDAMELAERIAGMRSFDAFSNAAREYSIADTAVNGGRVEWIPLVELQGPVAGAIQGLSPGQVTRPIPIPSGIVIFQVRGRRDGPPAPGDVLYDYVELLIPGGRSQGALTEAARIDARSDTCDDLYGVVGNVPANQLLRQVRPAGQIPADVSAQLANLDANEVSTALTRGGALLFLMLCQRDVTGQLSIEDTAISLRLRSERLAGQANIWLAKLRAEADIRIGG